MELKISSSQLIIAFKVDKDIRRKQFKYEDYLNNFFKIPFRTISVPDEIDPNIIRFEAESINGFSKISVSQNRLTFATRYESDFKDNPEKIKEYLANRSEILQDLLEGQEIEFVAYIIDLQCEMEANKINNYLNTQISCNAFNTKDVKDFSLSYSFAHTDEFYLNVSNSKFSEFKLELIPNTNIFRTIPNEIRNGINVVLDINSRLDFEKKGKYNPKLVRKLNELIFDIIKEKNLSDYLKGNL